MTAKTILIVDDDANLRKTLAAVMQSKGYAPATAATGQAALDKLRQVTPAVALLDLRLGDTSGLELIEKVRDYSPDTECILLTGHASQSSAIEAVNLGAYGYVQKPYDVEQLLVTVRRAIEKREAAKALRESEEKYRSLVANIPDVTWTTDDAGNTTFVSPNIETVYGYTPEEICEEGESLWFERIHPDDVETVRQAYGALFDKGTRFDIEYRIKRKDGKWIWLHDRAMTTYEKGGVHYASGVFMDVTARVRAESQRDATLAALRESEARYRSLFDSVPTGIYHTTPEGQIVSVNLALVQMLGYSDRESLLTVNAADLYVDLQERRSWMRLMEDEQVVRGFEVQMRRRDGAIIWVKNDAQVVRDAGGQVIGHEGSMEDITERVRAESGRDAAEEVLRRERDFAESLIETAQVIVLALDVEGRIVRFNPYLEEVSGYRLEEVQGKDWFTTFLPAQDATMVRELFRQAVGDVQTRGNVNPIVTKDGRERQIEWYDKTLKDAQGNTVGVLATGQDITERIRAEEEIRKLNEDLEGRVRERTQQLETAYQELKASSYSISHDLRTPLRAIKSFSQIVLDDYGAQLPPDALDCLNRVSNAADRMHELIDGLLTFLHLGPRPLEKETVSPTDLVHRTLANMQAQLADRDVDLTVDDLPTCQADPALLKQVFENLLSNALKFTRPRKRAEIKVGWEAENDHTVYFVQDNGVGFDMQYAPKLFGMFQRLHAMDEYEGTGIGLAIVQRIVQRHGGRVWTEAREGQGATFYFTL